MNLLTNRTNELYSNLATPHCVVGFGDLSFRDAQPRPYAVFLCVSHSFPRVMASCVGIPSGMPAPLSWFANPAQFATRIWRFWWQVFNLLSECLIMQNLNTIPSVIRPFAAILSFEVPTTELDPDFVPSISVCVGEFETLAETEIACRSYAYHPALIAMRAYQSMLANDYVGGGV